MGRKPPYPHCFGATASSIGDECILFGRDSLVKLKVDLFQLNQVRSTDGLQRVVDNHTNVFIDELGKVEGIRAKIHIDPEISPIFAELGQCLMRSEER